jgi:hypothetical protein
MKRVLDRLRYLGQVSCNVETDMDFRVSDDITVREIVDWFTLWTARRPQVSPDMEALQGVGCAERNTSLVANLTFT